METSKLSPSTLVLRLGHRKERDKRATTHAALVARAFGADGIVFVGDVEKTIIEKINDVVKRWGGPFSISVVNSYKKIIEQWKKSGGIVVHLTMYGEHITESNVMQRIKREEKKILIIIGAEKVPRIIYELADYNVAIGNQPHSEIAALAVFLDHLYEGRELSKEFYNAKIRIIPSSRGKKVVKVEANDCG
ncbi:MAG: tRNA (cytidine(56)-2'-O)-methyltransferase [Thermoproteales archaeon]|nr:tRNA (cytidine(56)-2'-O)-methyltransferase [Thermoproteales archaeon]